MQRRWPHVRRNARMAARGHDHSKTVVHRICKRRREADVSEVAMTAVDRIEGGSLKLDKLTSRLLA